MADEGKSRLGRGLAALIGDVSEETKKAATAPQSGGRTQRRAPVEFLRPNPRNPRRDFSEADLDELTSSLREKGIIQPIVVRPVRGSNDKFEIIAGERRWRAAQRAGLHDVPIVAVDVTEDEALQLAIIENVQRTDLNRDRGSERLSGADQRFPAQPRRDRQDGRQEPRSHHQHVAAAEAAGESAIAGALGQGQRRARPRPDRPRRCRGAGAEDRRDGPERSPGRGVGQGRQGCRQVASPPAAKSRGDKDADTVALERRVTDALGLEVTIDNRGEAGVVHVRYRSLDQLDEVVRRLERKG